MKSSGPARGLYYYVNTAPNVYDHSISQFGVLGCGRPAQWRGVPPDVWNIMEKAWRAHQSPSGAWSYIAGARNSSEAAETLSMTCAGFAPLIIIGDYSESREAARRDPYWHRGLKWIADHFPTIDKGLHDYDTLLHTVRNRAYRSGRRLQIPRHASTGCARVGLLVLTRAATAPGARRRDLFGNDFQRVPPPVSGCCSSPTARPRRGQQIKLLTDKAQEGYPWNQRPRDIANLTRWDRLAA